jgi:hypothetical protein
LYAAAAVLRREKWRFNYGRKITPDRIAPFKLPITDALLDGIAVCLDRAASVERMALCSDAAIDATDAKIAESRLDEIRKHPERVLQGVALEAKLKEWES